MAVSCCEVKATRTFTVTNNAFTVKWFWNKEGLKG